MAGKSPHLAAFLLAVIGAGCGGETPVSTDRVILDRNLFEILPSEISDAVVMETIFDGRTVYKRTMN